MPCWGWRNKSTKYLSFKYQDFDPRIWIPYTHIKSRLGVGARGRLLRKLPVFLISTISLQTINSCEKETSLSFIIQGSSTAHGLRKEERKRKKEGRRKKKEDRKKESRQEVFEVKVLHSWWLLAEVGVGKDSVFFKGLPTGSLTLLQ